MGLEFWLSTMCQLGRETEPVLNWQVMVFIYLYYIIQKAL